MAHWLLVSGLVLFGLLLILIEVLLVPGTTVVGIAGLLLTVLGVGLGYLYFDTTTATLVLLGSSAIGFGGLYFGLRSKTWDRFSLNTSLKERVNTEAQLELKPGDEGQTVSALRPSGTAEFRGERYEVHTNGEFLSPETPIRILKVDHYKIIVEPLNT